VPPPPARPSRSATRRSSWVVSTGQLPNSSTRDTGTKQDEQELKSTYAATGKKYLPVLESLFEDVVRLRPKIDSLTPYRKYRRSQQYLLESFDCLDKSVQMQKGAFKKMAEGDIEGAVKELLEASPLIPQGSKAIERFSSSL